MQTSFKKILVLGSSGFVGKNFQKSIKAEDKKIFLFPSRKDLNLLDKSSILIYLKKHKPDLVINFAGKVGGIMSNYSNNYHYLVDNFYLNINLITSLKESNIKNLINVSSSCIYPFDINYKIKESKILSGKLEPTNEGYALAKISSLKACEYISKANSDFYYKTIIPCNLYGPYDKFDENLSHMIPGVIKRVSDAKKKNQKTISIWGDGKSRREFMFIGDFIDFILFAIPRFFDLPQNLNVGLGKDYSIYEYYKRITELMDFDCLFDYDLTKPTGMRRKLIDNKMLKALEWKPKFSLNHGLKITINYYNEIKN
mgnify:CR=1 FL=1